MNTLNANLTDSCKVTNFLEEEERHYFAGEFAFVKFFSSQGLGLVLVELRKLKGAEHCSMNRPVWSCKGQLKGHPGFLYNQQSSNSMNVTTTINGAVCDSHLQ